MRIGICFIGDVNQAPYRWVLEEGLWNLGLLDVSRLRTPLMWRVPRIPQIPWDPASFGKNDCGAAHSTWFFRNSLSSWWLCASKPIFTPPLHQDPQLTLPTPKASQHTLWAFTEPCLPSWKTYTPLTCTRTDPCLWSAGVLISAQKRTFQHFLCLLQQHKC